MASTGLGRVSRREETESHRRLPTATGRCGLQVSLVFEMLDEAGHELLLVYGTTNVRGLEKMKDAMWAVDPVFGQHFQRSTRYRSAQLRTWREGRPDPAQKTAIGFVLETAGRTNLEALKTYTLEKTVFKGPHAPDAVDALERERRVVCQHAKKHSDHMVELAPPTLF